ncbi:hypothetical protein GCM10009841_30880 [Microlunatus panaciterrae]|uniref:Quercetin dioxygenase-like cupin family protein n=1 Tax=Microlunatus panaciterrae TaxID=400768 RepID=A0ABS2RFK7_9ACTN|nr:hypothetical protein [Microlunatus panaciterrae]MBM7797747.1 quercetin dioxygenase-like cupin family protein [Microlunatus panaciterrae]
MSAAPSGSGESLDPVTTNPERYRVLFENERVRVLEYVDQPGARTTPHQHPDSVMVTLSSFRRRLSSDGRTSDVELPAGKAVWLPAQSHSGENIGDSETHTLFVELKDPVGSSGVEPSTEQPLGPASV